jgi:alpha-1,6-mannosyltransferase
VILADVTIFWGPISGGVRTYVRRKQCFLAARGHRHVLIVPGEADTVSDEPSGRTITLRGVPAPFAPGYRVVWRRRAVEAALVAERPAVIEVGDPYLFPWAAFRARERTGAAVVLFAHADFVEAYVRRSAGRLGAMAGWAYARRVYGRADLVLAPSTAAASQLEAHGVRGVEVMPLGVDTEAFHPDRRREAVRRALGVAEGPAVLYVGRLSPEKGLDTLLAALPRLAAGGATLWVAGAGRLEGRLREAAARHPVRLLGFVSDRQRLAELYAAADVVVVPGQFETFGLTALEALASGTPVVASATGGPATFLTDAAGALVAVGDADALAHAVLRVGREAGQRRSACRRLGEAYAWEPALARLLARYERLAAPRAAATRAPAGAEAALPRQRA